MDVTNPRLLDAEGTGCTFPQNVCIYYPPNHIITQQAVYSTTVPSQQQAVTLLVLLPQYSVNNTIHVLLKIK